MDPRVVLEHFYSSWGAAHSAGDIDALVAHYDAESLFFGSTPGLRVGPEGIREYFEALPAQPDARVSFELLRATAPSAGMVAGASIATFVWSGNAGTRVRFTHTLVRRSGGWLVCVHHASPA
jgi:ketosteroid isomerase-like protein